MTFFAYTAINLQAEKKYTLSHFTFPQGVPVRDNNTREEQQQYEEFRMKITILIGQINFSTTSSLTQLPIYSFLMQKVAGTNL